jgi:prolyl-tRNA editing enzyme YbaK/EbsC (Cys-tRNA(Pro) deacylase)
MTVTESTTAIAESSAFTALQDRVTAIERKHHGADHVDESMRRARRAVQEAQIYSAVWTLVPEPYYTWPMSQRAACLGASSVHHLCKSLLLENKKALLSSRHVDFTNPQFVLVVLQYAAELDNKLLVNAIRALRPNVQERLPDASFDFRLASEADNDRMTGYTHNSVCPFGLLHNDGVLIVLAASIVPLKCFWMGGGHPRLKLGMSVSDFCRAMQPIVAPISLPRSNVNEGLD